MTYHERHEIDLAECTGCHDRVGSVAVVLLLIAPVDGVSDMKEQLSGRNRTQSA